MKTTDLQIVTPAEALAADLTPIAEAINGTIELITKHETSFQESTLEPRILIGREIARAKEIFGLSPQLRTLPATLSRRDNVSEPSPNLLGFSTWLRRETPLLKRTTALKYAKAFETLGLKPSCKATAITEKLKTLRHKAGKETVTLASILKGADPEDKKTMTIIAPPDTKQLRLEDAREAFHLWMEKFESLLSAGVLDDLDKAGIKELDTFTLGVRDRLRARLK